MSQTMSRREFLQQSLMATPALMAMPHIPIEATESVSALTHSTVADLRGCVLDAFVSGLDGKVLRLGDAHYESSCRHWSGRVFKRPGLIVRCAGTKDVVATVQFASDQGLDLAVRGGGHTRNSTCDGGILINLSDMQQLEVHPDEQVARVQAGLTGSVLDHATARSGLATVLGECPTVGISGLTLGGGLGRLMGLHGATCDNVLSAELVTAEGQVRQLNKEENRELFWAIRGGGGNFGVVTSWTYQLHPVGVVLAGMLQYPMTAAPALLRFLVDYMPTAPDDLDLLIEIGTRVLQYAPDAQGPSVVINVCCAGDPSRAAKTLQPLRTLIPDTLDTIRPMSYLEAQGLGDVSPLLEHAPPQYAGYHQSGFIAQFNEAAVDKILMHCENPPFPSWSFALDHYMHGKVCRVPGNETAFNLRQSGFNFRTTAFQAGQQKAEAAMAWVHGLNSDLKPHADGKMYFNYLTDQGEAGVRTALGSNYPRLSRLKMKYDPDNLFRFNPNIS